MSMLYKPTPKGVASKEMTSDVLNFIHNEVDGLKPKMLFMKSLKWKYLIRNILRGKNIMMTGPAGCGKTMAAKAGLNSLEGYNTFIINLGSTQDPRTTLIGNTQFDTKKGTVFNSSPFVKAIQTPNTVVVLDELTRAHPEAHNILMTVLDQGQRYLRLDEAALTLLLSRLQMEYPSSHRQTSVMNILRRELSIELFLTDLLSLKWTP